MSQLLSHRSLFDKPFAEVVWFHGAGSDSCPDGVLPIAGFPDLQKLEHICSDRKHRIVVADDCLVEATSDKIILPQIFVKLSHHLNFTFILLTQSLFDISKICRISTHYIVVFSSKSDQNSVEIVARQLMGSKWRVMMAAYADATSGPFGYLIVNSHPREKNTHFRLVTDIYSIVKCYTDK